MLFELAVAILPAPRAPSSRRQHNPLQPADTLAPSMLGTHADVEGIPTEREPIKP